MSGPRKKRPGELSQAGVNHRGDQQRDTTSQQSGDIRNSPSWKILPVYTDGCTVSVDERGVVIISQTILMQREAQIELVTRELVLLMRMLPEVLRAAQTRGKEACGTSLH